MEPMHKINKVEVLEFTDRRLHPIITIIQAGVCG